MTTLNNLNFKDYIKYQEKLINKQREDGKKQIKQSKKDKKEIKEIIEMAYIMGLLVRPKNKIVKKGKA